MANLQIKDVPEPLHDELRRRAALRDTTMRDYVLDLIRRDQAMPAASEWLEAVRALPRVEISSDEIVRIIHEERPHADRR
jgi:hypothetical protein